MIKVEIKPILEKDMKRALKLVWEVFLEFEAPDYTEEGIQEFKRTIDDESWVNQRDFYGAYTDDDQLLGVITTKDLSHIALFFVDGKYHKQGIGKKLYNKIELLNDKDYFTVNSSPYAHEVYKHMGFVDTDEEQCIKGLRFIPMRKTLKK
jgi:GNAT superfamily N-acetyltransferase